MSLPKSDPGSGPISRCTFWDYSVKTLLKAAGITFGKRQRDVAYVENALLRLGHWYHLSLLGSDSVGDDDLWHHHIGRFSPFFSFSFDQSQLGGLQSQLGGLFIQLGELLIKLGEPQKKLGEPQSQLGGPQS